MSQTQSFPVVNDGDTFGFTVACPAGALVIGGGESITPAGGAVVAVRESRPSQVPGPAYNAWSSAGVKTSGTTGTFNLTIWAICST
ncbi:MAG TPA: hypothetical protein VM143_03085 [Acidimicrobiales bacterium]|nr:hypothetical protein [Acidimicrobiales bacterium]